MVPGMKCSVGPGHEFCRTGRIARTAGAHYDRTVKCFAMRRQIQPCYKRPHAVSQQKIRQTGVFLFNDAGQRPQVSHQCITAGRTRDISELLSCRGTASVSDVVISGNGKAMPGEVFGKGGIPFYIFAHSVTYLKHGARRSFRCPKAVDYSAAPVR